MVTDNNSLPIHPLALKGIKLFNESKYFEAHEELELAWRAERGPIRELYRGILQVGVAYYHILNGNYRGGKIMIERAQKWLKLFPNICLGVDVQKLRVDADLVYRALLAKKEENINSFNPQLLQPVRFSINPPKKV